MCITRKRKNATTKNNKKYFYGYGDNDNDMLLFEYLLFINNIFIILSGLHYTIILVL